ncbi:TrkA family potassium uptake protein [Enterococcus dongliensis]|uniref:TrkA family potassium uptake protein n=1 Tax=Enterococcus dongliensis TaxID=2559925 RepID=A0AAP5KUC9_9ENTE|nr:TrkA family potassium uptake protein [Enterococcus dongliensis]MDT2597571.1 TrkA family potassium uptake protein [Enterococcus dongliensis]MDT2603096.1 TrkA family potassium uptake protein [Enterococcus dongliensis]MDT2633441.1 TrkA family potassium uptake protein [Enterococcus dongliensis]MDT2636792.1 TrkA family potassium uptake protein [Enterococcus dongliensis]MDT2638911.1 TrkA family potassium uptake protein [Enterococcus dongliensis]
MKQSFVIIGLGRFGGSICRTLVESGQEVLAIDSSEDRVNEYMNIATHAVVANAQDEMTLRSLGIRNFDHVIVAIGEDIQASILVTLMVKEMGVPDILAKAQNEYHARVLEKIGADRVVHPERDMGQRIAHNLISKNILDYLELSDEFSLAEINVSNRKFYGKTLDELDFRQRFGLNVVAIRRGKQDPIVTPAAEEVVQKDDHLVVIGRDEDVDYLDEKMNG